MKFTFKKHPRATGLARVGDPNPNTDIRNLGKNIGWIAGPNYRSGDHWRIWLSVKQDEHPGWTNVCLKAKFDTEPEAREWLQKNRTNLIMRYDLHYHEND